MEILKLEDIHLSFDDTKIIDGLSVSFWKGNIHALVGPNGAGKSTFAYTMMGIGNYKQATGKIIYKGEEIQRLNVDERAKKGITLAWQEPARFEGLTIKSFLKAAARNKDESNLRNALDLVGLNPDEYIDRAVDKTLSGGERKRIELASIYVMEPELVFLDEPDSGIDVAALDKIFEVIKKMKEKGTTVILITHSLTVLQQAEHAFLMCDGKIVDKGSVDKISEYFKTKCIPCVHKNEPDVDIFPTDEKII
ncbi:MAG: ABC transporter ATP-binding protein [Vulcanimicrobiota bacterium]